MFVHHIETIKNITKKLENRQDVLAVILCGSIAHGFETERSDVDLMIVISDDSYRQRLKTGELHYFETDACTYETGYIDGKYISLEFIRQVAERGSEPARFAFEGARPTYSQIENIHELIQKVVRYPVERKSENIMRFYAQFEAWKWYCDEALKQRNAYLLTRSVSNLILFSGRLILAFNETLYPYHKWFLRVLEGVEQKPDGIMGHIQKLLNAPTDETVSVLYHSIRDFTKWDGSNLDWPAIFMKDSELNWLSGDVSVADL